MFLNPTSVRVSWSTSQVEQVEKYDVTYKPTDARCVPPILTRCEPCARERIRILISRMASEWKHHGLASIGFYRPLGSPSEWNGNFSIKVLPSAWLRPTQWPRFLLTIVLCEQNGKLLTEIVSCRTISNRESFTASKSLWSFSLSQTFYRGLSIYDGSSRLAHNFFPTRLLPFATLEQEKFAYASKRNRFLELNYHTFVPVLRNRRIEEQRRFRSLENPRISLQSFLPGAPLTRLKRWHTYTRSRIATKCRIADILGLSSLK